MRALAERKSRVALWVAELGVFRFIGFTSKTRPKHLSPKRITQDHVETYRVNDDN